MTARRVTDLNGADWLFGSVPQKLFADVHDLSFVEEWLPAQIPGDVRVDLQRAGRIPAPFFGDNNEASQWVDGRDWWYRRNLDLVLEPDKRAFLVFEGIDYQSAVFVNKQQLGRHAGMFSRQIYELPAGAHGGHFEIAVRIWGSDALPKMRLTPAQRLWKRLIRPLFTPPNEPFPDRYATLKCQMQFGWDFAPRLRTCGIWDDVAVIVARSVLIEDVWLKSTAQDPNAAVGAKAANARIEVTLALDAAQEQDVRAVVTAAGKNFAGELQSFEFAVHLALGKQKHTFALDVRDVRLWDPWDRGEPNLYEIEVRFFVPKSGALLDGCKTTYGIRSIELIAPVSSARNAEPWNCIINGRREFIRGANWVPLDAIPGRVTREEYALRLNQVRAANVNFLRVWGGGLREKRAFYDLCDELGILVWQEFPFAGAILDRFPQDHAFLEFVQDECGAIVRAVRNHPSLVVWCGGNEFNTRGNGAVVAALQNVVRDQDGTRPFKPASPCRGESHNWRIWHRAANLADYRKDHTPFLSEFGLQAAPDVASLEQFLPAEQLFPPNPMWEYHHAQLRKLWRYAAHATRLAETPQSGARAGNRATVEEFVAATQNAQAQGMQIAIEHMRRRKAPLEEPARGVGISGPVLQSGTAGVAIWQFDDAWPAISWSVVDYYGRPKRAYAALQRLYAPVLASFDYPLAPHRPGDTVQGELWLINDWNSAFENVEWRSALNGQDLARGSAQLPADSSVRVAGLSVPLGEGENTLTLEVWSAGKRLSENEYDLNYRDIGEISPFVALLYPIYNALMR